MGSISERPGARNAMIVPCSGLLFMMLLGCGNGMYLAGDTLSERDLDREYPVIASNVPGVTNGTMFRFRDYHGRVVVIDKSDCMCQPCWKYAPLFEKVARSLENNPKVVFVTAFYYYSKVKGCFPAWLRNAPLTAKNHIMINTEKPGFQYMSYISDWWTIGRPHFHVLDANSRIIQMMHYYQIGTDGSNLRNSAVGALPTVGHVVPLGKAPSKASLAELDKICAVEGGACKCNGLVKYGSEPRYSDYHEVTTFVETKSGTYEGSIRCTNTIFGDPYDGATKFCYCKMNYTAADLKHHALPPARVVSQVINCGNIIIHHLGHGSYRIHDPDAGGALLLTLDCARGALSAYLLCTDTCADDSPNARPKKAAHGILVWAPIRWEVCQHGKCTAH